MFIISKLSTTNRLYENGKLSYELWVKNSTDRLPTAFQKLFCWHHFFYIIIPFINFKTIFLCQEQIQPRVKKAHGHPAQKVKKLC